MKHIHFSKLSGVATDYGSILAKSTSFIKTLVTFLPLMCRKGCDLQLNRPKALYIPIIYECTYSKYVYIQGDVIFKRNYQFLLLFSRKAKLVSLKVYQGDKI